MSYARVIIDISAEQVDRPFTYRIPEGLQEAVYPGVRVRVPFGSSRRTRIAFVIAVTEESDIEDAKLKEIDSLVPKALDTTGEMISLAAFMAAEYGCTMNQALQTVLPVKRRVQKNRRRLDPVRQMEEAALLLPQDEPLNDDQQKAVDGILSDAGRPSLLYGITGSGKTRVYIELIRRMQERGRQTIVLIPEISLTYQTVRELTAHLGQRVAVMHSRLSLGEKYEQFEKAANGEIDVMVGPRSALFTPFAKLGLIVIDEEHERTYQSDTAPRYDTRTVAWERAKNAGAFLLLGSATPSLESYQKALTGVYRLHVLHRRARKNAALPKIQVVDMRRELAEGNRSIFSGALREGIAKRLEQKEQIMLFLNRRGFAGFVSCRSCGTVLKCPHCDVSLTAHNNWYRDPATGERKGALLACHYCGFEMPMPKLCPECQSRYIAPFGTGTQKLEQEVRKTFPEARVLRMDADTTVRKYAFERILSSFQQGEADILIGTQMIVKGHDFPKVTLVGIVAADLSLNTSEYDASERTYQLITQAAGRSGRGALSGEVVIQSYDPSHYAITCAATGDYENFFLRERSYRSLLKYPPMTFLLRVRLRSGDEMLVTKAAEELKACLMELFPLDKASVIGPCNEQVYKINDNYRKILYIKQDSHAIIIRIRDALEAAVEARFGGRNLFAAFDIR